MEDLLEVERRDRKGSCNRWIVAELVMRLGDWLLKKRRRDEGLKLACLLP